MANAVKDKKLHHRILHHARHFLIPHAGNNHKPHALRPTALKIYSIAIISVKLFVTAFLFVSYPSIGHFASITSAEILNYTNASRAEAGIGALKINTKLNQAALLKAKDMIADDYFAHTAPDGTKPWEFLKKAGYSYSSAGENLAMDFTDASSVHTAFMNSPSHKKNIMNSKYTEMGVAVIDGQLNGQSTTILVEFFGTPYVAPAPEPAPQPAEKPVTKPAPATKPTNTNASTQPAPYLKAELTDQSAKELSMQPTEKVNFWVEFKNTGNTTWTKDGTYYVALNVSNPTDRHSKFEDESWVEYYRPANLKQDTVKVGATGRFEFTLKAPEEVGAYEEEFTLVTDDKKQITGGAIELPIVVVAPPERTTETQVEVIGTLTNTNTPTNTNTSEQPLAGNQEERVIVKSESVDTQPQGWIGKILAFSQDFYLIMLLFVSIALLLNILVKIRVQHPHVIGQTLFVIALMAGALLLDTHFLEAVPRILKII